MSQTVSNTVFVILTDNRVGIQCWNCVRKELDIQLLTWRPFPRHPTVHTNIISELFCFRF